MTDPDEFLADCRLLMGRLYKAGKTPPIPPDIAAMAGKSRSGALGVLLMMQCLLLPLMCEKDEDGHWNFQLHPNPDQASSRAWCWLWPVRMGWRSYMFQTFHGSPGHGYWQDEIEKLNADSGHAARMECLCGETIIDVAAFSLDFSKCYGRLNEVCAVIGHPVRPDYSCEKPVRLFRTMRKWLDARCAGAVLIGRDFENDAWLRACEHGIVTDDVAHGKYIQKILHRPYTGPQVLVAG